MRSYELIFIVHPDVDEDNLTVIIDRVKELVQRDGSKVVKTEPWGTRRLAYPIQKRWEGQYVLMQLELDPRGVSALERGLGLLEQIMRHLVVRLDQVVQVQEPEPEPEPDAVQEDVQLTESVVE